MWVHRFALMMTSAAIILIGVAAKLVYSSNGLVPNDTTAIYDNISYCCSSHLHEYKYTKDANHFISSTQQHNCEPHEFKTVPTWNNYSAKVCVNCRRSRHGNNALFNTYEILFWAFAWLLVAVLPWINSAILECQTTSKSNPSVPEPAVSCQCECHQFSSHDNSKATFFDKTKFSLLSMPIFAIAAFPIQNMVTQRCCSYVLFSIHPIVMAVMLFVLLVSSCFRVPNIYKFSLKWKWFNNKVRAFTVAFTCFTALFAIYEADYLYSAYHDRNDETCDFHYWLFIVFFSGIFCISLFIGFLYLMVNCFRSCGRVKWNDQGPEETCWL